MRMKCEVCGEEAGFFTETYDPMTKHNRTVWLCEHHQADMFRRIEGALSDMRTMLKYERGYVRGLLTFPDISDESKEKVREQILNSDEGEIPTIPLPKGIKKVEGRDAGFIINSYHIGEEKE